MSNENLKSTAVSSADDLIKFAKSRAKRLRTYLSENGHTISHSESLEATAQTEGYRDWNTYCALFKIAASELDNPVVHTRLQYPCHVGDRVEGTFRGVHFQGILLGLEETITKGVWRVKIHFDFPVKPPSHEALNLTRRRINCMLNIDGISVNLKGTPDGHITLNMP